MISSNMANLIFKCSIHRAGVRTSDAWQALNGDCALLSTGAKNINFQELAADLAQITFRLPLSDTSRILRAARPPPSQTLSCLAPRTNKHLFYVCPALLNPLHLPGHNFPPSHMCSLYEFHPPRSCIPSSMQY